MSLFYIIPHPHHHLYSLTILKDPSRFEAVKRAKLIYFFNLVMPVCLEMRGLRVTSGLLPKFTVRAQQGHYCSNYPLKRHVSLLIKRSSFILINEGLTSRMNGLVATFWQRLWKLLEELLQPLLLSKPSDLALCQYKSLGSVSLEARYVNPRSFLLMEGDWSMMLLINQDLMALIICFKRHKNL